LFRYTTGGGLLESHTHIEASLVMIAPYCAYATAEALSLSGIVAILFCGIVMAQYTRPNLSVDSQRNTQVIFKVLATLAETFVFIYMVRSDRVYELHVTCQGKIT
jgi:NhaP-type Na+/H+ or K+/H+ antiporter